MEETTQVGYDADSSDRRSFAAGRDEVVAHLTTLSADEPSAGISRGELINAAHFPVDAVLSVSWGYAGATATRSTPSAAAALWRRAALRRGLRFAVGDRRDPGRFVQMPHDAFRDCAARSSSFANAVDQALHARRVPRAANDRVQFRAPPAERCAAGRC